MMIWFLYYLEYDEPRKRPDWCVDECPAQRLEAFVVGRQQRQLETKWPTILSIFPATIYKLPFSYFIELINFCYQKQKKRKL